MMEGISPETGGVIALAGAKQTLMQGRGVWSRAVGRRLPADQYDRSGRTDENGTRKELDGRVIYRAGSLKEQSIVTVDCTTLSENLLESELFCHVKGSFTLCAIQNKAGLFQMAEDSILFCDEISILSLTIQTKVLRFQ